MASIAPNGEINTATSEVFAGNPCQTTHPGTGGQSDGLSCVTKIDSLGHQVFAVQIGAGVTTLVADTAGDIYISGLAGATGSGLTTTPGAFIPNPPGNGNPYVCKLSHTDGHPLYCTFIDVTPYAFTIDSASNAYIAGLCSNTVNSCLEKLNSTGTAASYRTVLSDLIGQARPRLVTDDSGNLFINPSSGGLFQVNESGVIIATVAGASTELPIALNRDANGAPQLLIQDKAANTQLHLRRYSSDLSKVLFDAPISIGNSPAMDTGRYVIAAMGIDTEGGTTIVAGTSGINLPVVHPTQPCRSPATGQSTTGALLVRIGADGSLAQSTYLNTPLNLTPGTAIVAKTTGASVLNTAENWQVLELGPATSEIGLSCIGNGASFVNMPLAPNEIVAAFGAGLGPDQPVIAALDTHSLYPLQLGGTQVTFDGVAAPLLYAANGQINLITPHALEGKTTTHVCVLVNNVSTNCLDMNVAPAAPGFFTSGILNSDYNSYAAAVNQDGTINSQENPAPAGSIVSLYVTGLGSTTPNVPDGGITPVPLPTQNHGILVLFSDQQGPPDVADTRYIGPAPLEVEGLGQINVVAQAPPAPTFFPNRPIWLEVTPTGTETRISSPAIAIWTKP